MSRFLLWNFLLTRVNFIYSEKATKFCEIFTLLLTTLQSKVMNLINQFWKSESWISWFFQPNQLFLVGKNKVAKPKKSFKLVSLIKKFVKNQIRKIARNSVIHLSQDHLILFRSFRRSCVRRPDEIFPQMVSTLKERP